MCAQIDLNEHIQIFVCFLAVILIGICSHFYHLEEPHNTM